MYVHDTHLHAFTLFCVKIILIVAMRVRKFYIYLSSKYRTNKCIYVCAVYACMYGRYFSRGG